MTALAASKIEAAEEWLDAHPTITNETDAAYAKSLENQLLALVKEADPIFEAEKKPHWDKCKEIDTKFSFRKTLGAVAGRVKTAWQDFAREQDRKKLAAAKAEAQAEADRQRKAAAALTAQKAEEGESQRRRGAGIHSCAAATSTSARLPEDRNQRCDRARRKRAADIPC